MSYCDLHGLIGVYWGFFDVAYMLRSVYLEDGNCTTPEIFIDRQIFLLVSATAKILSGYCRMGGEKCEVSLIEDLVYEKWLYEKISIKNGSAKRGYKRSGI